MRHSTLDYATYGDAVVLGVALAFVIIMAWVMCTVV